jgi:hypothetical protein
MARITMIPIGLDKVNISCDGETVHLVLPAAGDSKEAEKEKNGNGASKDDEEGSGEPRRHPRPPRPIFIPPPHVPLFALPLLAHTMAGKLAHASFGYIRSTEELGPLIFEFNEVAQRGGEEGSRHLVVTLTQRNVDIRELINKFSSLAKDTEVTVILTPSHG